MVRSVNRGIGLILICSLILPLSLEAQTRFSKKPISSGGTGSSKVTINRRNSGSSSQHGGGSYSGHNHGHSHHGHHHHYSPGFRFTPYIGVYPGTGYYHGGFYASSYSRIFSPFGGSFYYGTYAPGAFGYDPYLSTPYGYGGFPATSPLNYQVPRFDVQAPLVDQLKVADQFRQDAQRRKDEKQFIADARHELPLMPLKESTTEQRLRSQRLQMNGDQLFRQERYQEALRVYRDANHAAPDVPGPYYRMAITFAADRQFFSAVAFLKRTLEIEPDWPRVNSGLQSLFGDRDISRNALIIRVSRWLEQDIRDPDRSLLMGAVLFDSDREKATAFLETSAQLAGTSKYTDPYLKADSSTKPSSPTDTKTSPESNPSEDSRTIPPLPQLVPPQPPDPKPEAKRFTPSNLGFTTPAPKNTSVPESSPSTNRPGLKGPELPPLEK